MSELKDDLDRALRSVTFGEAPVDRTMRDGRRLRTRRRLSVLAGAVAIVAVSVGYPALNRDAAAPQPATSNTHTPSPHRDPVLTSRPPSDTANTGVVAQGTAGGAQWSVAISTGGGAHDEACTTAFAGSDGGPAARSASQVTSLCAPNLAELVAGDPRPDPVSLTGGVGRASGGGGEYEAALGAVAPDVTYLDLRFADGQQLKLIPVRYLGHRYIGWVAPTSMPVAALTAHFGSAQADNGQVKTAVPYNGPNGLPLFGLWFKPGQLVPPTASGVIGGGTHHGRVWSATAYEGPWGTCFAFSEGGLTCQNVARLAATGVVGIANWGTSSQTIAYGAAAPGVARLRITLPDGTVVQVTPVAVGNERLFAFLPGTTITTAGWTAFDAAGQVIGSQPIKPIGR